jgi:hypothetical protein
VFEKNLQISFIFSYLTGDLIAHFEQQHQQQQKQQQHKIIFTAKCIICNIASPILSSLLFFFY